MESQAKLRYYHSSVRKVRQVLDIIRGKNVNEALNTLYGLQKKSSREVEKLLRSAVSNMIDREGGKDVDAESLVIKRACADEGPHLKRFQARAMGRASEILKKTCHISIVISDSL